MGEPTLAGAMRGWTKRKNRKGTAVAFLIEYLAVNMAVAYLLHKSKIRMRIATVTHAVAFTVILFLLLASYPDGPIALSMDFLFGKEICAALREYFSYGIDGVVIPVLAIELATAILFFICGILFAARVAEYAALNEEKQPSGNRTENKTVFTYKRNRIVSVNRLYLKKCVMRC